MENPIKASDRDCDFLRNYPHATLATAVKWILPCISWVGCWSNICRTNARLVPSVFGQTKHGIFLLKLKKQEKS